jgi:hypothetical protein
MHSTLAAQKAKKANAPQYQRRPQAARQASIGIRRMAPSNGPRQPNKHANASTNRLSTPLPALDEEHELGRLPSHNPSESTLTNPEPENSRFGKLKFWGKKDQGKGKAPQTSANAAYLEDDRSTNYSSNMVDVLDTIDPEVATLTSLTNMQNSLFIPNLPWLNRHPTYNLKRREELQDLVALQREAQAAQAAQAEQQQTAPRLQRSPTEATMMTIDSQLTESRFAVLPEDTDLSGWSTTDKKEVNDHVRHMLHSRRSKMKRSLKGFGQYVRRRKYI